MEYAFLDALYGSRVALASCLDQQTPECVEWIAAEETGMFNRHMGVDDDLFFSERLSHASVCGQMLQFTPSSHWLESLTDVLL